ncbi:DsbA family protein [Paenibacillus sp. ACRSA]|uniref:DsbA family protein n=1 Tax=Paenibacillus sp. ACRSA TaxID=2918211 RepID=UPI001EF62CA3|nr:DsbA family protein [Paenibacillus sp. ACRSA]MCG7379433.1 DsbA family protein [Paenibacillus sp. ACRSA]
MDSKGVSLIYVWDAYCGWCYGFSNSLRAFHQNHLELPIEVLSGGLFIDERSQAMAAYPHIPEANKRIAQLTGVEFGAAYNKLLHDGTFIMDSEAAAIGFSALRSLAPEQAVYLAAAMQRAFYYEGKSLSDIQTYQDIAKQFNLDEQKVIDSIITPETRELVQQEFVAASNLGARSYPTLFLKKGDILYNLGGGAMTADKLEENYAQLI